MGEYIRALSGRKCSKALGDDQLCGCDCLAHVALGVIGNVNEKAAKRCRQGFVSDRS